MNLSSKICGTALVALALASAHAAASPIAITNASFEANALGPDAYTIGSISGWNVSASEGAFRPTSAIYFSSPVPDGVNVAYSNGGTISQVLTTNLASDTIYNLSLYVGHRLDVVLPSYTIELLAGGTIVATSVDPVNPIAGTFGPANLSYSSGASNALSGQALEIRLISTGVQADFDNVSLTSVSAVPEPETYAMMLTGFGILGFMARRRRKA